MGDSMLTPEQQRWITWGTHEIRKQCHGASNWHPDGIKAAVAKVAHLHFADVVMAAVRAADDRSLDTPGAIGNPSAPCWQERRTDRPQPKSYDLGPICGWCDLPEGDARALHGTDHEFISKAEWDKRAAAEQAARAATKETT